MFDAKCLHHRSPLDIPFKYCLNPSRQIPSVNCRLSNGSICAKKITLLCPNVFTIQEKKPF